MLSSGLPSRLLFKSEMGKTNNKSRSTISLPILEYSTEDMSSRMGNELLRTSRIIDFNLPTCHHDVIGDSQPSFPSFPNRSPATPLWSETVENSTRSAQEGVSTTRPSGRHMYVFNQNYLRHLQLKLQRGEWIICHEK